MKISLDFEIETIRFKDNTQMEITPTEVTPSMSYGVKNQRDYIISGNFLYRQYLTVAEVQGRDVELSADISGTFEWAVLQSQVKGLVIRNTDTIQDFGKFMRVCITDISNINTFPPIEDNVSLLLTEEFKKDIANEIIEMVVTI